MGEVRSLLRAMGEADAAGFFASPTTDFPSPMAAAITEGPGTMVGRYKILQLIGEGGFGSVFMAEQTNPVTRRVALKIIKLGMDTRGVIARFEAERQALAMMEHPHIARVLDAGATETGRPYFVMELVKGEQITAYADREKLTIGERLDLFLQVCSAIQHAHLKGIIHRDLKPGNILVSTQDGKPFAKVIDFGIAKATGARLTDKTLFTEFHQFVGTPQYMSPEQADGSLDIDTRTDVYSLGVLLYELLTGTTPFDATKLRSAAYDEMRRIIREEDPQKPSTRLSASGGTIATVAASRRTAPQKLGVAVRGELDWIVMKALEKDRARRFVSAAELGEDVRRHMAGEAVVAAPPTVGYRLRKFAGRHGTVLATAGAIIAVLVGGIFVSTWQALRAHRAEQTVTAQLSEVERERHEAQKQRDQAVEANRRAEEQARKLTRMAASHCSDEGLQAEEEGDPGLAMLWFARALKLDGADAEAAEVDRRRFGIALRELPRPVDAAPCDVPCAVSKGLALKWGADLELLDGRTGKPMTGRSVLYSGPVNFAQFSPDGKYIIAACTNDQKARLYETATGREVCPAMPHEYVGYVDFTPDGRRVITQEQGMMVLRSVPDGKVAGMPLPSGWCRFSSDGKRAIIHNGNGSRVWDTWTGEPVTPELVSDGYRVAMSRDGKRVATTGTVCRVWDAETGAPVSPPIERPPANWYPTEFSPDGKSLLIGADERWGIWDIESGKAKTPEFEQSGTAFWGEFSPDGTRIATISYRENPCEVMVRDSRTGSPVCGPIYRESERGAFSADNRQFVTVPWYGGDVEVWDIEGTNPVGPTIREGGTILSAAYSADGRSLATLSGVTPGVVRTWDTETGEALAPPMVCPGEVHPWRVAFEADGRHVRAGVFTLDPQGEASAPAAFRENGGRSQGRIFALSGDGKLVLGADAMGRLRVWEAETEKAVSGVLGRLKSATNSVQACFGPRGDQVALMMDYVYDWQNKMQVDSATVQLWDLRSQQLMVLQTSSSVVIAGSWKPSVLKFSEDGSTLLAINYLTRAMGVWDTGTGKTKIPRTSDPRGDFAHFFWDGNPVAESADQKWFLVDSSGQLTLQNGVGSAHVWKLDLDAKVPQPRTVSPRIPLRDGAGAVFSADGKLLCTVDQMGAELWDVRTGQAVAVNLTVPGDGRIVGRELGHFSPDGNRLLTGERSWVTAWDIGPLEAPVEQLEDVAELISGRRLTAEDPEVEGAGVGKSGGLDSEFIERVDEFAPLRRKIAEELTGFFRAEEGGDRGGISLSYRQALEARVAGATDDAARRLLADDLAVGAETEALSGSPERAILLAETAAQLNAESVAVSDGLATAYVAAGRTGEALSLCERFAGKGFVVRGVEIKFGARVVEVIEGLRAEGTGVNGDCEKMEGVIRPTLKPRKGFLKGLMDTAAGGAATRPE